MRPIVLTSKPGADLAERWNASLAGMPFATHYVTPGYFTDPYVSGARFAVLAEDAGEITAVLTGVRTDDTIVSGLFSRPQMVVKEGSDKETAVKALLAGLESLSPEHSLTEIFSWSPMPLL